MLFTQDTGRILKLEILTAKVLLKNRSKVASSRPSVVCLFWVSSFHICDSTTWQQKASVILIIQGSMFKEIGPNYVGYVLSCQTTSSSKELRSQDSFCVISISHFLPNHKCFLPREDWPEQQVGEAISIL